MGDLFNHLKKVNSRENMPKKMSPNGNMYSDMTPL
jgi:hypothetical protein